MGVVGIDPEAHRTGESSASSFENGEGVFHTHLSPWFPLADFAMRYPATFLGWTD